MGAEAGLKPVRRNRRLVGILGRFTLLASSLAMLAGLSEIGLRLVGARPRTATALNAFFDRDSQAGWRGRPNAACRFATVDFDTFVRHGSDGFREVTPTRLASVSAAASAPETRTPASNTIERVGYLEPAATVSAHGASSGPVWIVGDSMTWGWGVPNGATFVDLLAGADPNRTYRNVSAPGYSALQEQLLLGALLETESKPDLIVVVFTNNDLQENFAGSNKDPRRPHFVAAGDSLELVDFPVPPSQGVNFHTWLKQRSIAYNLLHFYLLNARTSVRNLRTNGKWSAPPALTPIHWHGLRKVYGDLKRLCDAQKVKLAIAFIPGPCEVTHTEQWNWPDFQRQVHDQLIELTRELGVPLLDTTDEFKRHFSSVNAAPMTFHTDPHINETGHRLVAQSLAGSIRAIK